MPSGKHQKTVSVRLPEPDVRRFKSVAATRGITLQEAVHEALESWAPKMQKPPVEPLDALEGSLANVDVNQLLRHEKQRELAKDSRWS